MMDLVTLIVVYSILWICTVVFLTSKSGARKLPPGPYQFPIVGNILQLGTKPHRSLTQQSRKYGPLMSLKLGSKTTIVVSSAEMAKIVLQKHDLFFSGRSVPIAAEALNHDKYSAVWTPVGNQWRKLRKIMKEQMFTAPRLDASQGSRREKLQQLYEYLKECSETGRAVDIREAVFTASSNLLWATHFSIEFAHFVTDSSRELRDVVSGFMEVLGSKNYADFFPVLKSINPQGILKRVEIWVERLFAIFDALIDDKLKSRGEIKKNDLVEALIDIHLRDDAEFTRNDINHLLMDLFVGGTEATANTVEWAMAELVRHPKKMSILRDEIRDFIRVNGEIHESDIPRLPYLQATVKEIFRLRPSGPFLLPHKAVFDIEINDYIIPKNAEIIVNVWAIGRDPSTWSNADSFMPERFLNREDPIDFKGTYFELVPFGAGRRICPGLPLAYRMVHPMLVTLVGNFEWKLEDGKKPEELDIEDKFTLTLTKAKPLVVVPIKTCP